MGVVNNRIRIDELEKGGGSSIEERLSHLEDEYTNLVSYKTEEVAIGEWYDGKTIYRKVIILDPQPDLPPNTWVEVADLNNCFIISVIGSSSSGASLNISAKVVNNKLSIQHFRNANLSIKYIVLEYTELEE